MIRIDKPLTAQQAAAAKQRKAKQGWDTGTIEEAGETVATGSGNPVIALRGTLSDGTEWLNFSGFGAEKLRHALAAVSPETLARYETAGEVSAESFVGVTLQIRFEIEKRRGYPDRSVVTDFKPATEQAGGTVHQLRSASSIFGSR